MALRRVAGHPHVLGLLDCYPAAGDLVLVTAFCPSDLELVVDRAIAPLPLRAVACLGGMLLSALAHIHACGLVHRDVKPANCLVAPDGRLKLADFGLTRPLDERGDMSHQVCTRWYRPPELLYGARRYGCGVDVWGAGCVVAELLLLSPLFPGTSDIDQLHRVLQVRCQPVKGEGGRMPQLPRTCAACTHR